MNKLVDDEIARVTELIKRQKAPIIWEKTTMIGVLYKSNCGRYFLVYDLEESGFNKTKRTVKLIDIYGRNE